jgi:hypothetical protein
MTACPTSLTFSRQLLTSASFQRGPGVMVSDGRLSSPVPIAIVLISPITRLARALPTGTSCSRVPCGYKQDDNTQVAVAQVTAAQLADAKIIDAQPHRRSPYRRSARRRSPCRSSHRRSAHPRAIHHPARCRPARHPASRSTPRRCGVLNQLPHCAPRHWCQHRASIMANPSSIAIALNTALTRLFGLLVKCASAPYPYS